MNPRRSGRDVGDESATLQRALFVQGSLQPPGGGNGVAVRMIEALRQRYAVDVLTWHRVDLAEVNRFYGTSLRPADFTWHAVPVALRRLIDPLPLPLGLLKRSILLRICKRIADRYDVVATADNEADFGRRGIQYVHFPWAYQPRPADDLHWYHGSRVVVDLYYRLCALITDFSFDRMRQNVTLVNSEWTGEKVRQRHGIESETLYPPISNDFDPIPWVDREDGFVCMGRIAPEKGLDTLIDIVAAVRAQGRDVHLHLIGTAQDAAYYRRIRKRVDASEGWVLLEENLSREELVRLVSRHRYGLHGMTEEHFGMAVAEMVRAGCIVFIPRGGGQTEIVGSEPALLYASVEDAVAKIIATLGSGDLQAHLREHLAARAACFSTARFTRRLHELVQQMDPRSGLR